MRRRVCRAVLLLGIGLLCGVGAGPASAADAGPWVRPVDGPVMRAFDPPRSTYGAGHRGVDLSAAPGTPVLAAGAGRVSYAGLLAGRGVVVVVHGGLRTTYEPVAASVHVGEAVAVGAVLGRLTLGGHCLGGCLHWGLLRGEVYLDPLQLLRRGPSRLLPVPAPVAAAALRAPAVTPTPSRSPSAPLQEVAEPSWSLRAAEAPWGLLAVVALLLGLFLLRAEPRRRPDGPQDPEHRPPHTSQASTEATSARSGVATATGQLVDLRTERSRRRIA